MKFNTFLIGPQYGYRQERFQLNARLLLGKMNITRPEGCWGYAKQELIHSYEDMAIGGFTTGISGAYELTDLISIGPNVSYFSTLTIITWKTAWN